MRVKALPMEVPVFAFGEVNERKTMTSSIGNVLARRLGRVLIRRGESVQITSGGKTRTLWAQVTVLTPGEKYTWFTSAQTTNWTLPALMIRIAGDDPAQVGDSVSGDALNRIQPQTGRVITVRAVYRMGIGGVTVWTLLLAA